MNKELLIDKLTEIDERAKNEFELRLMINGLKKGIIMGMYD